MGKMLHLRFHLGDERYALPAAVVAEVIPLIDIAKLPGTAAAIAGVINYHDAPVPVIDLAMLAFGRPAALRISTRILILHYQARHLLGVIAERVTDVLNCSPAEFQPTGIENRDAPYLGPVRPDARGVIQRVDIDALLTPMLRDALFPKPIS